MLKLLRSGRIHPTSNHHALVDRDDDYVVRASALEDNVRLYRVVKGDRHRFAGANVELTSGVWHELRLVVRGTRFELFFEGRSFYVATDAVFATAGRVKLWTKADSVTWFDDCGSAVSSAAPCGWRRRAGWSRR
jgi:hypothetical protein